MNNILSNDILTMPQIPWPRQANFHPQPIGQYNNPNKILPNKSLDIKTWFTWSINSTPLFNKWGNNVMVLAFAPTYCSDGTKGTCTGTVSFPNNSIKTTPINISGSTNKKTHISLSL